MSFLSSRYGIVMFADEATIGTDQIDIDLNADTDVTYQLMEECQITPTGSVVRPSVVRATHDNVKHEYIENGGTVSMTGYLTGKTGAAGTAPDYDAVFLASNFAKTTNASTSVVYNATTGRQGAMTVVRHHMEVDSDGKSRIVFTTGVVGNLNFSMAANDFARYSFEGTGVEFNKPSDDDQYFQASDGTPLLDNGGSSITYGGTAAYSSKDPIVCKGMTVTVGGTTYNVSNISIDVAFNTGVLQTVNGSTTNYEVFNTRGGDAPVSGSFQLVSSGSDYDDVLSKWPAGTAAAVVFTVTDGTDTIQFDIPNAQLGDPGGADVEGIQAWEIPFFGAVNSTGGNDSLSVTYT